MYENYQNLANAIIILAARDYRSALRRLKRSPENTLAAAEAVRLERFFQSAWYEMLTDVEGEYLIERIREEEANERRSETKRANLRRVKRNGGLEK